MCMEKSALEMCNFRKKKKKKKKKKYNEILHHIKSLLFKKYSELSRITHGLGGQIAKPE